MAGHNLPAQLTTLIGREREIGELKAMLVRSRLVTLTGAPGCGKTRLALAVAADTRDMFRDGIFFVELGPVADSALLEQTIARSFGVREGPDRPPRQARQRLRSDYMPCTTRATPESPIRLEFLQTE